MMAGGRPICSNVKSLFGIWRSTKASKPQPIIAVLQTPTVKASYQYTSIPKLSEYAYLVASMTDWQGLNLLNGDVNLYFENNYVGTTFLDAKAFGDTLKLSLGKDEGISVKRTKAKTFTEKFTDG